MQQDHSFDAAARVFARGLPRRGHLKLILSAIMGTALSGLRIKISQAAVKCDCHGTEYEPDVSCCTSSGVQPRHPILDLDLCPKKQSHGDPAMPNGCGANGSILRPYIPQRFGRANFSTCCKTHDICYGTCNNNKSSCDTNFLACLVNLCNAAYGQTSVTGLMCSSVAIDYHTAVFLGGGGAFEDAQKAACDCCGVEPCQEACQGGTCSSAPACGSSGCGCLSTAEGSGTCFQNAPCSGLASCSSSSSCPPGFACAASSCCTGLVCAPICTGESSEQTAVKEQLRGSTLLSIH